MKRIVDIVPASPGWYARWRFTAERTVSHPVTVWALVEDAGPSTRHVVVGVDAGGQWPGGVDNDSGADFIRYVYQARQRKGSRRTCSTRSIQRRSRGHENRDHRSGHIGSALARAFRTAGHTVVVVTPRHASHAEKIAEELDVSAACSNPAENAERWSC